MAMRSELSDLNRRKPPVLPARSAKQATAPSPLQPESPPVSTAPARDTFVSTPPTRETLERLKASIQALERLPSVPDGVLPKRAWLEEQAPRLEAAEKALASLTAAMFDHGVPSEDELMRLTATVQESRGQFREIRERAGLQAPVPPLDPGRPAFQLTDGASQMARSPLTSLLGVLLLPVAITVDAVDAVTRPAQAARYPADMKAYRERLAEYEKARTVPVE
ncbi:MAG: hypothetical protein VKP72_04315 [bacterium]|nr:hypothetical protein [bacterium]